MKKFTLLALATLMSVVAFAQQPARLLKDAVPFSAQQTKVMGLDRKAATQARKAPRRAAELVTLPEEATTVTYYTTSGTFALYGGSGWVNATNDMPSVEVAVVGSDIYVQGLAYWFKEGWIKGSLEGNTATFPSGQLIGTDSEGDEFIVGSNDGSTLCDIVFTLDEAAGLLTAVTSYIFENGNTTSVSPYTYWMNPVFSTEAPVAPEAVVLPAGVELKEYALVYQNSDKSEGSAAAAVAVDGNDVYFQGFSSFIPEALIKGTKEGNVITFPADQYLGSYQGMDSYLYVSATFTYDEETDTYTSEDQVFSVLGNRWYDVNYYSPVLKGVVERAAMPANPVIKNLAEDTDYGYYVTFSVPNIDVNGEGMVASKLAYKFYTDVEHDVQPLTFGPATHQRLTTEMTEIPFGFTEDYDFYANQIYLNSLYSADWNKLGIQSIYRGGGEENVTEIQWFDIKDYTSGAGVTFDFNALPEDWPVSTNSSHDGDITEDTEIVEGNVTLTVSPSTSGTANRYWKATNGIQLRVYGGTLTFTVPEYEEPMTQITFNNGKWNNGNSADSGTFDGNVWTGSTRKLVVTIAGNTQLNSIAVVLGDEDVPDELVVLPEGIEGETWTIEGTFQTSRGSNEVQYATEVAFDGNDIYVKGLAYYMQDAWIKGTIANGIATFPSGQFMGQDDEGKEYMVGADEDENICDIEFVYDAEAKTLTQQTYVIYENSLKNTVKPWALWTNAFLYAGDPIILEPVEAPEDLVTETYLFKGTSIEYSESEEGEEGEEGESEPVFTDYSTQVEVGFDGDDVYFQGFAADCPTLWVKATKNEAGQYVIPANQFMGTFDVGGFGWFVYDYYFTALDEEGKLADVVLNYDAETQTFTTDQLLALNGAKRSLYYYMLFQNVVITKMEDVAAVPADPEIVGYNPNGSYPSIQLNIPAEDAEGNALLKSKLAYQLFVVQDEEMLPLVFSAADYDVIDEDMTVIPYMFGDDYDIHVGGSRVYLNHGADAIASWTNIGVQSIYNGGGETNMSNIVWLYPDDPVVVGINDLKADRSAFVVYDLQGRRVAQPAKGLYIVGGKKVIVK